MSRRQPVFSIIVPTYRRPEALRACVKALAVLDYPRDDFEVIIVDDGGSEPLTSVIQPVAGDLRVKVVWQPNAGPAAARNFGAVHATGDMLAFTDDDCAPASDWLRAFAGACAASDPTLLGGRTVNALRHNAYAGVSQLIIDVVYAHYNREPLRARFFASNNMAVPTELFRRVNGFDPDFRTSEDRDLCDRWLSQGYQLRYVPEAVIYHAHVLTLSSFWKQHAGYGRGAWLYHTARAERGTGSFQPDWEFYRSLLRSPLSGESAGDIVRGYSLLMVAQLANAAGCFEQATKAYLRRRRSPAPSGRPEQP
ncbi:MAG TPA: glycosyltransferase [Nitrospiraceae bacterium]|nr:glycosyltransferase [Nitrospiraceae bacterium]